MNDPDQIIKEAVGVHVHGQEPLHTADEYEAALLVIAREEQDPTENIAQAMARVARDGNQDVSALIFAADRVRARDAASGVTKMDGGNLDDFLADGAPRFTRDQAEAAMMSLAKREARPGEDTAAAFARLCESDARMQKLYDLGHACDVEEEREALSKGVTRDERFDRLLVSIAKMRRTSGETIEQAAARLLAHDPVVRDAYAAVYGG